MHSSSDARTTRAYFLCFAGLIGLTALTVAVAHVDLGGLNNTAAIAIAASKAALVATIFMHVRHASRLVLTTIAASIFWLTILIGLTMTDFLTRGW